MRFDNSDYPDGWIYFDNSGAPSSSAAAGTAQPTPNPQPAPAALNRPPVRPDPYAAFWSQVPASRLTQFAWAPPIFPDAFGRYQSAAPAPLDLPPFPAVGLFAGMARPTVPQNLWGPLPSFQPATADPTASWPGLLGQFAPGFGDPPPSPPGYSANPYSPPPTPLSGIGGYPGSGRERAGSNAVTAAPYTPGLPSNLQPDSLGYRGGSPSTDYPRIDSLYRASPIGLAPDQSMVGPTLGLSSQVGAADESPNVILVGGDEPPEAHRHGKIDPGESAGLTDTPLDAGPKALPTFPAIPFFARPGSSAAQPASPPRAVLPPNQPPQSLPVPNAPATVSPSAPRGTTLDLFGNPMPDKSLPRPLGGKENPPNFRAPAWPIPTEDIAKALAEGGSRLPAAISAALPKYDGETTYGILITNEGNIVPLKSARAQSFRNYTPSRHVEGKAAIWIRENGSSGGVLYHNNTEGTCGFCNSQVETLLPNQAGLRVIPPSDAVAMNAWARPGPKDYTGNDALPKPPRIRPTRQLEFFQEQP